MLEHCGETAQKMILKELFASGASLIQDQYGNYVTQHIIAHGKEEDRMRIINLVTTHLVQYSRHKYASNVVEKSIEFGTDQQRQEFLTICTTASPGAMSPLFSLMRDQYGNYVIRKRSLFSFSPH
jgi:mRNA-binding protein PUF3